MTGPASWKWSFNICQDMLAGKPKIWSSVLSTGGSAAVTPSTRRVALPLPFPVVENLGVRYHAGFLEEVLQLLPRASNGQTKNSEPRRVPVVLFHADAETLDTPPVQLETRFRGRYVIESDLAMNRGLGASLLLPGASTAPWACPLLDLDRPRVTALVLLDRKGDRVTDVDVVGLFVDAHLRADAVPFLHFLAIDEVQRRIFYSPLCDDTRESILVIVFTFPFRRLRGRLRPSD
mmetsp:Transcript_120307/g.340412  ORF Transcript_120307/g.340412 Transcript_120307/m.340412 type:complete len:234 (+) Transcript_120307:124-825(+)